MSSDYSSIVRVGVDLAKSVAQLHAVAEHGQIIVARKIRRSELLQWCSHLPAGCIVAMEACSAAHLLARQLNTMGLAARLIAPSFVPAYRMTGTTGKNDATDAEAICEAASRPQMRFVPPKTLEQQSWLAIHRLREGFVKDRTACVNRIRGILFEFGIDVPRTGSQLPAAVEGALATGDDAIPALVRDATNRYLALFESINKEIGWCDQQIKRHIAIDVNAQRAYTVRGVGLLGASAVAATVGNLSQFQNARQFGAWLGLVPKQRSTGGVTRLGRITKRGDPYLRYLLVLGAGAALNTAPKSQDRVSQWAVQVRERIGWRKATVALANRNARILWRTLTGRLPQDEGHPIPNSSRRLSA